MPLYEMMVITAESAVAKQLVKTFRGANATLRRNGGLLRRIDNLGVRPLAMAIKGAKEKQDYGRYLRLRLQASPQAMKEVETRLKIDESVLRFLTMKKKVIAPKTQAVKADKKLLEENKSTAGETIETAAAAGEALEGEEGEEDFYTARPSPFRKDYKNLDYYATIALISNGALSPAMLQQLKRWEAVEDGEGETPQKAAQPDAKFIWGKESNDIW
jgi:small subunit ribosomal protein S6